MLKNIVTLKSRLEITQGQWKSHHSTDRIRVPIGIPQYLWFHSIYGLSYITFEILNFE